MRTDGVPTRRFGPRAVSLAILAGGAVALGLGDLAITASHPGAEMARLLRGIVTPDLSAVNGRSLLNTVAFAVLGVGLGGTSGFLLALVFPRFRAIRILCAFLRAIHELFWALLLMQIMGLGPLTGILAIALPYAGIFAKVFSEIIEEADLSAIRVLPRETGTISAFAYARLPDLLEQFGHYSLYRLECGLRSTLVLGFIGLPTIGFELDAFFKEGDFSQAAALLFCFYGLVATRRLWARVWTLPLLVTGSLIVLPSGLATPHLWQNLARFLGHDIVPTPLRGADLLSPGPWTVFAQWLGNIATHEILPGAMRTLIFSQIALCGMAILSLVLFPLVCRRFSGRLGRPAGRALLIVVRSTPDYMLAYVLLQTLGPSMLPAVIALTLHNGAVVAYLMGQQADALPYRADAPRGTDLYFYETLPRLYGQFLAYVLYRWEIILRESAIFGILGVTTLGFYVDAAISELRLDVAVVLILATAGLSMTVEALSRALRASLRLNPLPGHLSAGTTSPARAVMEAIP